MLLLALLCACGAPQGSPGPPHGSPRRAPQSSNILPQGGRRVHRAQIDHTRSTFPPSHNSARQCFRRVGVAGKAPGVVASDIDTVRTAVCTDNCFQSPNWAGVVSSARIIESGDKAAARDSAVHFGVPYDSTLKLISCALLARC